LLAKGKKEDLGIVNEGVTSVSGAGINTAVPKKRLAAEDIERAWIRQDLAEIETLVNTDCTKVTGKINRLHKLPKIRDPGLVNLKRFDLGTVDLENRLLPELRHAREVLHSIYKAACREAILDRRRVGQNLINPRTHGPSDRAKHGIKKLIDSVDAKLLEQDAHIEALKTLLYRNVQDKVQRGHKDQWLEATLAALQDESGERWIRELGYKLKEILERTSF